MNLGPAPAGIQQIADLINRFINLAVEASFIAVTIVLIYAAIMYLTSGGDPGNLKKAGQAITWALLGILFLALAWLILKLIEAFTGVGVTHFCLGFPGVGPSCF